MRERRIRTDRVVRQYVVAAEVIPRGGILVLVARSQRLRQHPLSVAQILLFLLGEPRLGRAFQIQQPAIHQVMPRLDIALGLCPTVRLRCPSRSGPLRRELRNPDERGDQQRNSTAERSHRFTPSF